MPRKAVAFPAQRWLKPLLGLALIVAGVAAWFWLPRWLPQPDTSAIPQPANFPAPDLHLTTLEGEDFALSDFRGQVVLLNNWATWCPPCIEEMPVLDAYYRDHAAQGFVLVAVAAHEYPFEVRDFLEEHDWQLALTVVPDPEERTMTAFRQTHLPASYVIDRDGAVRLMWVGAISRKNLEKFVTPLLEK